MSQPSAPPELPASRYPLPKLDELPEDIQARIQVASAKAGFVPNVMLALAHRPDEFRAFFAYYDALMLKENQLSKADKEMIVVATSATNDCHYCIVSHGALLRIYGKRPLLADQIANNYRKAALSARERAMLDFAVKVATRSAEVAEADFEALAAHGFSREDAWDIGAIAAFFALSNRMANLTAMQPNAEFYVMGRQRAEAGASATKG
jgi:uncharacterized peroxidase-related enzyme